MVVLFLILAGQMTSNQFPSYEVDGLPGSALTPREADYDDYGNMVFDFAVFLNGEQLSPWTRYPLYFNPAKTFSVFDSDRSTIEVTSQLPFSAEYTYAFYDVDDEWNLTLGDFGEGDYYGAMTREIDALLSQGDFIGAYSRSMEIMYPGAMPYAEGLCSRLVVGASEVGTIEAFEQAGEVCMNLLGMRLYEINDDSFEYFAALKFYAHLCDPGVAELVMERIRNHE